MDANNGYLRRSAQCGCTHDGYSMLRTILPFVFTSTTCPYRGSPTQNVVPVQPHVPTQPISALGPSTATFQPSDLPLASKAWMPPKNALGMTTMRPSGATLTLAGMLDPWALICLAVISRSGARYCRGTAP